MTKHTTTTTKKIKSKTPFEDKTSSLNSKFPSMSSVEYVLADLVNVPDQTGTMHSYLLSASSDTGYSDTAYSDTI